MRVFYRREKEPGVYQLCWANSKDNPPAPGDWQQVSRAEAIKTCTGARALAKIGRPYKWGDLFILPMYNRMIGFSDIVQIKSKQGYIVEPSEIIYFKQEKETM